MTSAASNRETAWTIRPAVPGDLNAARDLIGACELPLEGVADHFGDRYAVAEARGRLVGVAGVETHGRFGLLRSVAVSVRLRGEGVGEALVRDRLAWARASGLEVLYLLTTTADRYFARHGFSVVDRSSAPAEIRASGEFSDLCPASSTLMRRTLADSV